MGVNDTKLPLRDEVYRYAKWVREGCDGLPFDKQLRNRIAGDIEMMYEAHPVAEQSFVAVDEDGLPTDEQVENVAADTYVDSVFESEAFAAGAKWMRGHKRICPKPTVQAQPEDAPDYGACTNCEVGRVRCENGCAPYPSKQAKGPQMREIVVGTVGEFRAMSEGKSDDEPVTLRDVGDTEPFMMGGGNGVDIYV